MGRSRMQQLSVKQFAGEEQLQKQLQKMAAEIVEGLSQLDAARSKELLSDFVSELFISVADQRRKEENHRKQAAGIKAAKVRGVRFGRSERPLPDNFDDIHQAWRGGQLTLNQAAERCGMPVSTFYDKAVRRERTGAAADG